MNRKTLKKSRRQSVRVARGRLSYELSSRESECLGPALPRRGSRTFRKSNYIQSGSGSEYDIYKDGGIKIVEGAIIPPEVIIGFREFIKSLED